MAEALLRRHTQRSADIEIPPPPPPPPDATKDRERPRPAALAGRRTVPTCHRLILGGLAALLSFVASAQTAPAAPTALGASHGNAQATLRWRNPSDNTITGYSVRSATSTARLAANAWSTIPSSGATTVMHTVSSLANGTRYYFQVRATNANGDSPPSNTATIQLAASPSAPVAIPDDNLRAAILAANFWPEGRVITQQDMATLSDVFYGADKLLANDKGISDLTGLEYAFNLTELRLNRNSISDLSPLAGLVALEDLWLGGNSISDLSPLADLTSIIALYLHDNSISDISSLAGLTALQLLRLEDNMISDVSTLANFTALKWLYLNNNSIVDVSVLSGLTALTRLWLGGNSIADVSSLSGLTALTWLRLEDNSISNISVLANFTALTQLQLNGNSISDASSLSGLTALTELNLNGNSITNASPLTGLTALTELDLGGNSIENASPLMGLTQLTALDLGGNSITDASPLANLTMLSTLNLDGNSIANVSPLQSLTALTTLDLGNNSVGNVSSLSGLTALTTLDLGGNSISDVSVLNGFAGLTTLHLEGNSIRDVSSLQSLTGLTSLNLDGNSVADVSSLASLTALTTLRLRNNSIANASPLTGLTMLLVLDLGGNSVSNLPSFANLDSLLVLALHENSISDLSPLAGLASLQELWLHGNAISDLSPLAELAGLTTLYLHDNSISDLSPLAGLASLKTLWLRRNAISNISPLVRNGGLASGDDVDLRFNRLGTAALVDILTLLERGVTVLFDPFENHAPQATGAIGAQSLLPRARLALDIASYFSDEDLDYLTYSVTSSVPAVAVAEIDRADRLHVRGVAEGWSWVVVTATDPGGLRASIGFTVVVGNPVAFLGATGNSAASVSAPEGGVATLTVYFAAAREADVSFRYALGVDSDPATADANTEDYYDVDGTVTIPAGETSATIAIRIRDDARIEPPREVFTVTLQAPEGVSVGSAVARVEIEEGVCDRSAAVRVALSGDDCTATTAADLAAVWSLELRGRGIGSLQTDDFAGLSGLRSLDLRANALATLPANLLAGFTYLRDLDLSHNALEELPDGLFAGVEQLRSLDLRGNPGTPFALRVALERTDAAPWSPSPATVRLAAPTGAPFDIYSELSAVGGTLRAMSGRVPAGATTGTALAVEAADAGGTVRISATVPALPPTICDGLPCWQGLVLTPGEPLVLFSRPPTAGETPALAPIYGEVGRISLDSLVSAGDAGDMRWTVTSSDETVATVRIVDDELVVEPVDFAEGEARIEVVAVDATGQTVTVAFDVYVEFYWPARATAGWRGAVRVAR